MAMETQNTDLWVHLSNAAENTDHKPTSGMPAENSDYVHNPGMPAEYTAHDNNSGTLLTSLSQLSFQFAQILRRKASQIITIS